MKFLNIHRAEHEYFKDSSVIFSDMLCFDLAVASSIKHNNNNKKKKKMEKLGIWQKIENKKTIDLVLSNC